MSVRQFELNCVAVSSELQIDSIPSKNASTTTSTKGEHVLVCAGKKAVMIVSPQA